MCTRCTSVAARPLAALHAAPRSMQHATQPVKYAERSKERKEPYLFVTLFVLLGLHDGLVFVLLTAHACGVCVINIVDKSCILGSR